jgi:hypothetical protein
MWAAKLVRITHKDSLTARKQRRVELSDSKFSIARVADGFRELWGVKSADDHGRTQ